MKFRDLIDGAAVCTAYMLGSSGVTIGPFMLAFFVWALISAIVEDYER